MPFNLLVLACVLYVIFLFAVAFIVERRAAMGRLGWLRSPLVYTLSLSIYCTAWTFYGAVGYAARSGLEFLTIYFGPTLVFVGWWWILRKLVRIGRQYRVTSIADLISARFGKSNTLGVIVTLIAVVATTPYIALQLQSVVLAFGVFATPPADGSAAPDATQTAFWVAVGLALFTILFGTRNLDAKEQHHGIVTAIAVEAVVKLVALLAVGSFVVWGIADGVGDVIARIDAADLAAWQVQPGRWTGLIFLSAVAVITPAAHVPGHGGRERRRGAPCAGKLGLSAVPDADEPLHRADRGRRAGTAAGRGQPRHVRADAALVRGAGRAGDAGVPGRVFLGHLDGDRGIDRAGDDDLEPRRHPACGCGCARRRGRGMTCGRSS